MELKGIGASPGISVGRARVIQKETTALSGVKLEDQESVRREIEKFESAVAGAVLEIEALRTKLEAAGDDEGAGILDVQIELLADPQIKIDVVGRIEHKQNANDAVVETIEAIVQTFVKMKDEYMSARATDMQDIGDRILKHLTGVVANTRAFEPNTIIIAEDISPSDSIAMDISNVTGFATKIGGKTSHTAIIAKSRGIPAIVGCGEGLQNIRDNDVVVVDGTAGFLQVNPDEASLNIYYEKQNAFRKKAAFLRSLRDVKTATADGKRIKLLANIVAAEELDQVFENGGEGVGLLRTELLFMDRNDFPDEDEQFEFYRKVALKARGNPVTVRTLDVGGDKQLKYFDLPHELNPFLGYRAIRISLDRKEIFITQLKAILRASAFGNLKIMLPMISNVQEVRTAKVILAEAKKTLESQGIAFDKKIELGIMIEIPSAAVTADILAREVDFFSIGTNDLCQYTLAVDRMNEKIKEMYDPYHPGLLRLIQNVIEQAVKNKIHVAVCGEFASEPAATLLLLGMGLEDFSMSATAIPTIKHVIINHSIPETVGVFKKVMNMETSEEIKAYLEGAIQ